MTLFFKKEKSILCLFLACSVLLATHFFYYPKWDQEHTEATLSWDVSGYYMYLPAVFIYSDIRHCSFRDELLEQYRPTPDFQQAFKHESGNFVMKYSAGLAVQFSPFFFIAHLWASNSTDYPADGFSFPYQFMISMGSLLIALLGLFFVWKVLLCYFDDLVAGISLLAVVIGTNYLNYSAIDGAMTHNWLFTLYALLIYTTIRFYKRPNLFKSCFIGFLIGLATLTRPTEIISCLIPLLWGVNLFSSRSVKQRIEFLRQNYGHTAGAVVAVFAVASVQFIYWKYATGQWIVYSYEDQGFSWLSPHIYKGLFSYKSGWLVYSPLMVFALIGFYNLYYRSRKLFSTCFVFSALFIYIAFAWDIWWYGGSLGQRTMVQAYPVLVIPLAAFVDGLRKQSVQLYLPGFFLLGMFSYLNIWFTHHAHRGKLLHVGKMTGEYYWSILGRYEEDAEDLKLLDSEHLFYGARKDVRAVYKNDFEALDSVYCTVSGGDADNRSLCLDEHYQSSPELFVPVGNSFDWVRAAADFRIEGKEWTDWEMTQFIIKFYRGEKNVDRSMIRIHRLLERNEEKRIYMDAEKPEGPIDKIGISWWNAGSNKKIAIDNLVVEIYREPD